MLSNIDQEMVSIHWHTRKLSVGTSNTSCINELIIYFRLADIHCIDWSALYTILSMYTIYTRVDGKNFECLNFHSFAAHSNLNSPFEATLPRPLKFCACTLVHSNVWLCEHVPVKLRLCCWLLLSHFSDAKSK